jgi:hypothetical protein
MMAVMALIHRSSGLERRSFLYSKPTHKVFWQAPAVFTVGAANEKPVAIATEERNV